VAKSGAIVDVLTKWLGFTKSGVNFYMANLRPHGLVPNTGTTGTGAADFETSHAVNLLIGLVASPSVASAVETVKKTRAALRLPNPDGNHQARSVLHGLTVEDKATFGEALDALIDDIRSGRYRSWLGEDDPALTVEFTNYGEQLDMGIGRIPTEPEPGSPVASMLRHFAVLTFERKRRRTDLPAGITRIHRVEFIALTSLAGALGARGAETEARK
jgi:hypothetical protein